MKTKAEKKLELAIEQAYYRLSSGQMINITDIPKVFSESRRAILEGATVDQAVRAAILMYCQESK